MGRTFWKGAAGWWELEIVRQVEIKMRKKWHGVGWTGERILWFNSTKLHAGVRTPEEKEQSDDAKKRRRFVINLEEALGAACISGVGMFSKLWQDLARMAWRANLRTHQARNGGIVGW